MHVKLAGCVAGIALWYSTGAAQSPPAQSPAENTPTFKSQANLVNVPVVVRDNDGNTVADLKQQQFELFDNGKKREITSFALEQTGGSKDAANPPQRFTAWVFDDLAIAQNETDLKQLRDAATQQFTEISPGDRFAVFTSSCQISQNFTDDKEKLMAAVAKMQLKPVGVCRAPMNEPIQLVELKSLAKNMATMPGQRSIVFVSTGLTVPHDDFVMRQIDPTDLAVQNKVLINAVHLGQGAGTPTGSGDLMSGDRASRGVQTTKSEPGDRPNDGAEQEIGRNSGGSRPIEMMRLAEGTGGTFVEGGNDFARGLHAIGTPQCIYLLGFPLDDVKPDGKTHKLKVTVNDSRKLRIQTRSNYIAPKS